MNKNLKVYLETIGFLFVSQDFCSIGLLSISRWQWLDPIFKGIFRKN